jgi:hypothetical protein
LSSNCTPEERRKQENNCNSVNFYFTPPEGPWSVTLKVKKGGDELESHTFNLTSRKSEAILLKAVSVCGARNQGNWQCQNPGALASLVSFLRKVAPTDKVSVLFTGMEVRRDIATYPSADDWEDATVRDISALYTLFGAAQPDQETFYFGLYDPALGGSNGTSVGHGAMSRAVVNTYYGINTTPETVAHETEHLLGLRHTTTAVPADDGSTGCWGPGGNAQQWNFPDNKLHSDSGSIEVGFDVAQHKALPGDEYFELMAYCYPRWTSPHRYLEMLPPDGPLSAVHTAAAELGDFWLVRGSIDASTAQFDPLMQLATVGDSGSGSGTYKIEVRDTGGTPLFTRLFTPASTHPDLGPDQQEVEGLPSFTELIPVQAGASRIVVLGPGSDEIGSIELGGSAPAVSIDQLEAASNQVDVSWSVSDPDSTTHTYRIDYSADNGANWVNLAAELSDTALSLPTDQLAGSEGVALLRITASDGVNIGTVTSEPFGVPTHAPQAQIFGPELGSFHTGDLVWLEAAAWDIDDGTPADGNITWSSSRDGALGSGASVPVYDLSAGQHTITLTVHDSDNNTATDSISITVSDAPIIEGEDPGTDRTWGDDNCDGSITLGDAIAVARFLVGLGVSQGDGCPAIGVTATVDGADRTWGDLDCSGSASLGDAIALARFLVGIVPNVAGCPAMGSTVRVQSQGGQ